MAETIAGHSKLYPKAPRITILISKPQPGCQQQLFNIKKGVAD